ncbi:MAG: metal-dependent transcriptional regulator [Chloroflexi bacterium]|nr:metal-dependent transcriptional regulator [Chloroflexota bacterium]
MKVTETGQELLEQLWMAEEDGRASLPNEDADQNGVEELVKRGLAQWENDVLTLTEVGHSEAAQVMRRHRLAERLLSDVLATEEALLDGRACRMEHALFDGVDDSICTLLGHPRFCPHGKPIPQGQCCQQQRQSLGKLIMPLRDLRMGQEGHIAYTRLGSPERAQKLMAMGVLPGVPVRLLHSFPSFVFEAGYSQFAVDEEIAADIYVRLAN